MQGHTVDHCHKLHGFPLGYKPKSKNNSKPNLNNAVQDLSATQCKDLLFALSHRLSASGVVSDSVEQPVQPPKGERTSTGQYVVHFYGKHAVIQDLKGRMAIGNVDKLQGLYLL